MVKTRVLILVGFLVMLAGCGFMSRTERANPDVLQISAGKLGEGVSLVQAGGTLVAVYSDWDTTGLYEVEIPESDHLPSVSPSPRLIDRIDMTPPLSASFGEHTAIARGNTVTVLYLARAAEDKMILKIASHDPGAQAWILDAIEPPGTPLALLPAEGDRLDLFWAAGSLLHMSYPQSAQPDTLLDPFAPGDRAGAFAAVAGRGITVYDSLSHALLAFRWNGYAFQQAKINGAGPINSSLLLEDGRLAVLSWDPATRRLELREMRPDEAAVAPTLVTMSEGTTAVSLLPLASNAAPGAGAAGERGDRLLFLYDDARRLGGGKSLHELSLLAPGSGWGPAGRMYRRIILLSGTEPIMGFSAVETADSLYVLVHQDGLKLLKLRLPG